jgi:aminoglycoside 6'-N-acetyltransferase I
MRILDFSTDNTALIKQIGAMLVAGFAKHWPGVWPDLASGRAKVRKACGPDRISRVATDDDGSALGWIAGTPQYRGHVWELDPLIVRPDRHGLGVGRALVSDFEEQVRARGGLTVWLGTDDEDAMTSLAGIDLFPHVLDHLSHIRNLRRHPYEFYQKLGYVIIGALPDANGPGKPDTFMAKSVARGQ